MSFLTKADREFTVELGYFGNKEMGQHQIIVASGFNVATHS